MIYEHERMLMLFILIMHHWQLEKIFKLEKVFKKKHSCGFSFLQTVLYTNIFYIYLNFKHKHYIYTCPVIIHCHYVWSDEF